MEIKMYAVGPTLDLEQILSIEKLIKKKLPQQYVLFLQSYNGGAPYPNWFRIQWKEQKWAIGLENGIVAYFLSIYDEPDSNFLDYYETFDGRIPDDTISIGHDPGGNLILMGTGEINNGKVYFWMHSYEVEEGEEPDYSNVGFIANSLNEFLDSMHPEPES